MKGERCKELGSAALRKTLKELNISTLDTLAATICTIRTLLNFLHQDDNLSQFKEFLEEDEQANKTIPVINATLNIIDKFEKNVFEASKVADPDCQ